MSELRPIHAIALEIHQTWSKIGKGVYFGAVPYLHAMNSLKTKADKYYEDTAEEVINYGLSNMTGFRGPDARRLKAELKEHLK